MFEPTGEECGTLYDETTACPLCKSGRTQVSELVLDLRKTPKTKQIARTLAEDEIIVSQQLAELLVDSGMTGFELRPVRHNARYQDDPIYLHRYPSGRYLLQLAEAAGAPRPTWEFYVWLNRRENRELWDLAKEEQAAEGKRRETGRSYQPPPTWYQVVITSRPVSVASPTRAGIKPFEEDPDGKYRCPLGHTLGLNLLSEVWVHRDTWDGSDFARTEQMVGHRQGVLVPAPILLISPRLRRLLEEHKIKGYGVEVAHMVP